jgi:hypothetical protein
MVTNLIPPQAHLPQRLKPHFFLPYRRPKGLLHPVIATSIYEFKRPKGLLHPVIATSIYGVKRA